MYNLITSPIRFSDPITGKITRTGELCLQDPDGDLFHTDRLPARRLIPINQYLKTNQSVGKTNHQCPPFCDKDCDLCMM